MKFSSSSLRPVGSLATMRAATAVLIVSAFLLGALLGGGLRQTAWAQEPTATSTPTFQATVTATIAATATPPLSLLELSPTPTIPAGRNLTPVIGTLTPTATLELSPTPTPLTLPDGCKFHSLLVEADKDYTTLTFRCPGATVATPIGGTD